MQPKLDGIGAPLCMQREKPWLQQRLLDIWAVLAELSDENGEMPAAMPMLVDDVRKLLSCVVGGWRKLLVASVIYFLLDLDAGARRREVALCRGTGSDLSVPANWERGWEALVGSTDTISSTSAARHRSVFAAVTMSNNARTRYRYTGTCLDQSQAGDRIWG